MDNAKKRKLFLWAALFIGVVSTLAGWYFTLRAGVYFGDDFYYRVEESVFRRNSSNQIRFTSDHDFKIVSDQGACTGSMQVKDDAVDFSFSDGTSVSGVWNGMFFYDGDEDHLFRIEAETTTDGRKEPEFDPLRYTSVLCSIYFHEYETISHVSIAVMGVLFYILGIVTILYPEQMHFFLSRWRYQHPELSESGILVERISGAVICVMGIGVMSGVAALLMR